MSDKTTLFKATIKTFKAREKNILNTPADKQVDKTILKKAQKSEFSIAARNVVTLITKLKEYLTEIKNDYLNDESFLGISQSTMSDSEIEKIDIDAKAFMKNCRDAIKQLAIQTSRQTCSKQARENKLVIVELLDKYLESVCKMYSQHKALRMKRDIDRRRISRLQLEPTYSMENTSKFLTGERGDVKSDTTIQQKDETQATNIRQSLHQDPYLKTKNHESMESKSVKPRFEAQLEELEASQPPESSKEEMAMLMEENEQLFESMSTMVDEVRVIEGKMVEISQLQELFTEKVLEQDKDIDRLAENMISSSENVKEANDEIRKAMQNNAGFRVWIMFFLLVCTFSLLFLDWYNV